MREWLKFRLLPVGKHESLAILVENLNDGDLRIVYGKTRKHLIYIQGEEKVVDFCTGIFSLRIYNEDNYTPVNQKEACIALLGMDVYKSIFVKKVDNVELPEFFFG